MFSWHRIGKNLGCIFMQITENWTENAERVNIKFELLYCFAYFLIKLLSHTVHYRSSG